MKTFASFFFLFLLSGFWDPTGEAGDYPIAVSPGSETGLASVSQSYPTFSWPAVEQASTNRIGNASEEGAKSFNGQMDGGTEGPLNTFYGQSAGAFISTGQGDTFVGASAGTFNTTGNYNTFIGRNSGYNNTTGNNNSFLGESSGNANTTGNNNTFLGYLSGRNNTTGNYNTFFGGGAGYSNTTGYENTFIGMEAGWGNTTGWWNTFLGRSAGVSITTGNRNTFIGEGAGWSISTGNDNTFIGEGAGWSNTMGDGNIFIGTIAGRNNITGNDNTFIGNSAGYNETGSNKLYIDNSGTSDPLIYGEFDSNIVNINGKLGIGTKTPGYPLEIVRTGTNASIVVNRTDGAKNYMNATNLFGNFGTVNNYPLRLVVNSFGKMTLNSDNSLSMASGATCTAGGVWTNASSIALKENISALSSDEASTTLLALNPVKYNYKAEKDENHVGFIAEEVPELVAMKDRKSLSPMDIVAVLTKVTQDQQKQLLEQKQINENMKMEIAELKKKLSK
jgi:hypothetical protein